MYIYLFPVPKVFTKFSQMNITIKRLRILFFLITTMVISQSLMAQKATLKGVVRDGVSNEELIGATVMIIEANMGEVTDIDGKYRINSIRSGDYTIAVSYLGYQSDTLLIRLEEGQVLEQNVFLNYETIMTVEVVVSAQAEGQMSSINQQLADNTIKNIISAKKIQETPNANAAEAIGRISGVSIVRSGGEGSKVVVRGLAPKFNKVQVEGISMASTGGDDRSSDLSMISPYMLDGIEVSKAAMANQEGDVIGGTVNFILRQAPDSMTFDVILQGGYSSLNSSFNNYKLVIGGSNRFFNGKLGVFAQIDLERRDRSSNEVGVNYRNPTNQLDSFDVFLGSMEVRDVRRDIKRGGATVVMDYKLRSGSLKFSNFVSLINNNQISRYESYNPGFSTHSYGMALVENDIRVMTNALKYKTSFGAFTFDAGISFSQSKNKRPLNTNFFATESNAFDGVDIISTPDRIQFYAKNQANDAKVQFISKSLYDTNEDKYGADMNITYDVNFAKNLNIKFKAGIKYKKLKKDFDQESARIPIAQAGHGAAFVAESIQSLSWLNENLEPDVSKLPYGLFIDNDYEKNEFPGGDYTVQNVTDVDKFKDFANVAEAFYFKDYYFSTKDDYTGEEEYKAAYFMPIMKIGNNITFIPGVRYEHNKTTYTGVRGDNTFLSWDEGYFSEEATVERKNSFWLPMIHLKYKPLDWFDVRLAYTHTIARPDYNQIVPKYDISMNSVAWNNPYLTPSLSQNMDVYLSAYKSKLGLLTVGGFYKKIEDLIYDGGKSGITVDNAASFGLSEELAGTPISKIINNENPAKVLGLELEWQTRFWYMDNFMNGLVFTANYTRIYSSVDYERTVLNSVVIPEPPFIVKTEENLPYTERLVFQPTDIFNVTLGYDYKKLSTRLSFLYQNDIFSKPDFFRLLRGATDDYFRIDLSMTQKLPWEGFQAMLNFSNVTSSKETDLLISKQIPTRVQYYGFTFDVGVRYRIK